ncbi:Protein LOW PSII ACCUMULATION 3, chloroplastic [Glycine max]|nr:Protein LOW PSII ACCUMULATION 3, chloroplastic [Glycine max]
MVMGISSPSYKLKFLRPRQLEPLSLTPPSSSFRALELKEKVQPLIPWPGSSDEFIDANVQLALAVIDGITIGSLDDVSLLDLSVRNTLDFDFEDDNEGRWQSTEPPSLYIFINCSTRELAYIEKYVEKFATSTPTLLFNLELDTLWPSGLPSQRFAVPLSFSIHSIRIREYSKTVAIAPYIVNYNGAVFCQYPGPWQVMLKQADGSYACIAESANCFSLGEAKEELLRVLGLQEEEGSSLEFLRRGYKVQARGGKKILIQKYLMDGGVELCTVRRDCFTASACSGH